MSVQFIERTGEQKHKWEIFGVVFQAINGNHDWLYKEKRKNDELYMK